MSDEQRDTCPVVGCTEPKWPLDTYGRCRFHHDAAAREHFDRIVRSRLTTEERRT